jgi:Protein of unknown function (DUF2721)
MHESIPISNVVHVIQLAVAPVFLLTGVGAVLNVLANRLGRVVDRFRTLHVEQSSAAPLALSAIKAEMAVLAERARMIHWAIGLCTSCALFVCILIATLFLGSLANKNLSIIISLLFILAMFALILGLLLFLREIALARSTIDVTPR